MVGLERHGANRMPARDPPPKTGKVTTPDHHAGTVSSPTLADPPQGQFQARETGETMGCPSSSVGGLIIASDRDLRRADIITDLLTFKEHNDRHDVHVMS